MSQARLSSEVVEQAAAWLVRLDAGECQADEFDAWMNAAPEHAAAVKSLQHMLGKFHQAPPGPTRAALEAARGKGGRGLATALALCAALLLPAWTVWQVAPPGYLLADVRTGTAEWLSRRLDDGSLIQLNGRTAVDLQFDAKQRTLRLVQGEILVEVAADSGRPFVVQTAFGQIRALGTRFIVRQDENATVVLMVESKTAVSGRDNAQAVQVVAGQQVRVDAEGVGTPSELRIPDLEQAWSRRRLVAKDQPLAEVLEDLARHQRGYLHFNASALKDIKVTAVLPLDDPAKALALLAQSFNLRIRHFSPWVTVIEPAGQIR